MAKEENISSLYYNGQQQDIETNSESTGYTESGTHLDDNLGTR
jgi:hypothetical protein